jgi:hypothetical protein
LRWARQPCREHWLGAVCRLSLGQRAPFGADGALTCKFTGFGHLSVAHVASNFVSPSTATYFKSLLRNDGEDYLAAVATWADSFRYSKWGRFTSDFHFIDAKDDPPRYCGVDFERDCKKDRGCVVSALHNYTTRLLDTDLPVSERAMAAKFVIHFVGDIHQPLHTENVERGGNGIPVLFDGKHFNLHHVWDTSIVEKLVGGVGRRKTYEVAKRWAGELTREIKEGKYASDTIEWLRSANLSDPVSTAMAWANEGNAYVCTTGECCPARPSLGVGSWTPEFRQAN